MSDQEEDGDSLLSVAPKYRMVELEGACVLVSADGQRIIRGDWPTRILRALAHGPRSEDDLLDEFPDTTLEVAAVVADLRRRGVLCDLPARWAAVATPQLAAAQLLGVDPLPGPGTRLLDVGASPAARSAAAAALRETPDTVVAVLCDDFCDDGLTAVADSLRGQVWVAARLTGPSLWISPLIGTVDGPCWECLQTRLRLHEPLAQLLAAHEVDPPSRPDALPATLRAGAALLALHLTSLGAGSPAGGALHIFDHRTWAVTRHPAPRLPQCPACGDGCGTPWLGAPLATTALGRAAAAADKGATDASMERAADGTAHEMLAADRRWDTPTARAILEQVISPVTGVVGRLATRRVPPADPVAVAVAEYSFISEIPSLGFLERSVPKRAAGKGWDLATAEVGALGEALERHSSVFRGDETRRRAALAELRAQALDPASVLLFSDSQYAGRDTWNARLRGERDARHLVPRPLLPDEELDWSPVRDLFSGELRWLPSALVLLNHREPGWRTDARLRSDPPFFGDSNGTGAGATLPEAVWRGLGEAVERDAVGIWWYNRLLRPRFTAAEVASHRLQRVEDHLANVGRTLWFLDVTTDLGLPVVCALSARSDDGGGVGFGFAADTTLNAAAEQAALELLQILRRYDAFDAAGTPGGTLPERFYREVTVTTEPYLTGVGAGIDAGRSCSPDELLERLRAADLRPHIADISRPDLPLRVAKVVVPGLRHMWPRLAPGRLFEVPVGLGLLPQPREEAELNPWPVWV